MKTTLMISLALLVLAASSLAGAQQVNTIRGSEAANTDQPPAERAYAGGRPGGQKLVARTFDGQPPLIPHSIDRIDEITADDNPCWECHMSNEFKGKKMPRVGSSHLIPGKTDSDGNPVLNMTRFQCNSCHVPQVDAKPLVDNSFKGLVRKAAPRTVAK